MHLVWENVLEDGKDYQIDVDFVCSMVPVEEKPDGKTAATQNYLLFNRPVGETSQITIIIFKKTL